MAGLTQIKIPVKASERTIEKIVPYLRKIQSKLEPITTFIALNTKLTARRDRTTTR